MHLSDFPGSFLLWKLSHSRSLNSSASSPPSSICPSTPPLLSASTCNLNASTLPLCPWLQSIFFLCFHLPTCFSTSLHSSTNPLSLHSPVYLSSPCLICFHLLPTSLSHHCLSLQYTTPPPSFPILIQCLNPKCWPFLWLHLTCWVLPANISLLYILASAVPCVSRLLL